MDGNAGCALHNNACSVAAPFPSGACCEPGPDKQAVVSAAVELTVYWLKKL